MYDIQVPVLQVLAGKEGCLEAFQTLWRRGRSIERRSWRMVMRRRRRWRGCGGYAGQLGGGAGHGSLFPLDPFYYFCSSFFNVLSTEKKLNNNIFEIHLDQTSWIICHLQPCPVCQNSATTVARTFQESPANLNTFWWSMEPAVPQKYCKTDTWSGWWHAEGKAFVNSPCWARGTGKGRF